MPKYDVTLTRSATESTHLIIEAASAAEANQLARERAGLGGDGVEGWTLDEGNIADVYLPDPESTEEVEGTEVAAAVTSTTRLGPLPPVVRAPNGSEESARLACPACGSDRLVYVEDVPRIYRAYELEGTHLSFFTSDQEMDWDGCHGGGVECAHCGMDIDTAGFEIDFS